MSNRLAAAGIGAGFLGMLPFFVTPELNTARSAEIADHVVPGLLVVVAAGAVLAGRRRDGVGPMSFLIAGFVILLAGVWMVSTQVPLLNQARRGDAPWGASLYYSASALLVLTVGAGWVAAGWTQAE